MFASSSSIYGNADVPEKHEGLPVQPLSPYALQKYGGERYCQLFYQLYGFEAIALLAVAAYIGWWLGRRTLAVKIEGLHADIRARRVDLNDCQKSKSSVAVAAASMPTAATVPVTSLAAVPIVPVVPDDLKIVEGIGPKIEGVLNKEGILTFAQLALLS